MTHTCLKCGGAAAKRFRLVLGTGRIERLCRACSDRLSTLVQTAGDTCQLSLGDSRFLTWLRTDQWPLRDGRLVELNNTPGGPSSTVTPVRHGTDCPCCAIFAEEGET